MGCFTFAALLYPASAFGVPHSIVAGTGSLLATSFVSPSILLSDDGLASIVESAVQATQAVVGTSKAIEETGAGGEFVGILKGIAFAVTGVFFLGAGLTFLIASVIVPAAAKELEQECKELAPELWDQYSALLKDGETMANRPELIQELGAKLQPLIDAKVEGQFAAQKEKGIDIDEDEAAWKALGSLNAKMSKAASSAAPTELSVDMSISDQWDDDVVVDAEITKTEK